eukprot:361958-Chlamydomonas_euryale.AAC.1
MHARCDRLYTCQRTEHGRMHGPAYQTWPHAWKCIPSMAACQNVRTRALHGCMHARMVACMLRMVACMLHTVACMLRMAACMICMVAFMLKVAACMTVHVFGDCLGHVRGDRRGLAVGPRGPAVGRRGPAVDQRGPAGGIEALQVGAKGMRGNCTSSNSAPRTCVVHNSYAPCTSCSARKADCPAAGVVAAAAAAIRSDRPANCPCCCRLAAFCSCGRHRQRAARDDGRASVSARARHGAQGGLPPRRAAACAGGPRWLARVDQLAGQRQKVGGTAVILGREKGRRGKAGRRTMAEKTALGCGYGRACTLNASSHFTSGVKMTGMAVKSGLLMRVSRPPRQKPSD